MFTPLIKEGRQAFLRYKDQNHRHNDNNQKKVSEGRSFQASQAEFFEEK